MLKNGDFELDWSEEKSHNCLVITAGGSLLERDISSIFTPPGWTTWFRHIPDEWDQPEVRDVHLAADPVRVHDGVRAMLMFSVFRRHDGGFLQQVVVEPGEVYRLSAYAHAWSNHNLPGHEDCYDAPRCSCGVGSKAAYYLLGATPDLPEGQWNDAILNFIFAVGVDPTGGTDPYAPSVIWGHGAHIYNKHAQVPPLVFEAEADVVTVFLRSFTQWGFKHNDAYWDTVTLTPYSAPPAECRGQPRVQYERTYVLLPQGASEGYAVAAAKGTHSDRRTIGYSADDAGIGDLDVRNIIAVNPTEWPGDLRAFYKEHYPGVNYTEILASSPDDLLRQLLGDAPPPPPPPPPQPYTELNLIDPHLQTIEPGILVASRVAGRSPLMQKILGLYYTWRYQRDQAATRQTTFKYVRDAKPNYVKVFSFEDVYGVLRAYPGALVGVRHPCTNDYGGIFIDNAELGARRWVDMSRDALYATCEYIDRNFPGRKKPYFYLEAPNELTPSNNAPLVTRSANLDQAIALEVERTRLPIATIGYCAGVGNPTEEEFELLVPLARTLERTGGAMGLHLYWWANKNKSGLDSWWPYHAGRYQKVDEVLVANGVRVDWLCGESGVVQSEDGYILNPVSGWMDVMSWSEYLDDLLEVNYRDNLWNKTHGGRFKGRAYFTTCAKFCNWFSFRLGQPEFEGIARALGVYV